LPLARSKRTFLSACAALLLAAQPFTGAYAERTLLKDYNTENTVYKLCDQARAALNARNYSQARDILLQAAAYDPTSFSGYIHTSLADAYRGMNDYTQAISEAENALHLDPRAESALYTIALTYYDLNNFDLAQKYLQKYMQTTKDPGSRSQAQTLLKAITVYQNLKKASKCAESGDFQEAKRLLEKAAAFDPSDFTTDIHANLAYVLERAGEPEKAITEGQKVFKMDPTRKQTAYTIGLAYQDIGKFDDAISWLQRYVNLESDGAQRDVANNFIHELSDDRSKVSDKENNLPDYLNQLKANNAAEHWSKTSMPIKVWVSDGAGVFGYRPSYRNYIIKAYDTWCEASGKKLNYKIVKDPGNADIKVSWTRESISMQENGRQRLKAGLTTTHTDGNDDIQNATVVIQTVHAFNPKRLIEEGEAASTCMHEVGHSLGLGHSTCVSDIMYFGSSTKQSGMPTKRDRNTIARIYQDYPVIGFVPQSTSSVVPVQYLPPPAFMPPEPPSTKKLTPPMFMPPPPKTDNEKLSPPLFMPPPLKKSEPAQEKSTPLPVPMFMPPPIKSKAPSKKENSDHPQFFMPPPPK